jgi:hypothetical protein
MRYRVYNSSDRCNGWPRGVGCLDACWGLERFWDLGFGCDILPLRVLPTESWLGIRYKPFVLKVQLAQMHLRQIGRKLWCNALFF